MQSCLGVYIEDDIIKYAKLQKDKDIVKVEAYNVVFYDSDFKSVVKKIISETYSYKVPISINVSNEIYNNFMLSTLLSKQDTKKAVNIEFEMLCNEEGYNRAALDHKYLLVEAKEEPERQKALSICANKNEIIKRTSAFEGNKVNTITPITTSIINLIDEKDKGKENYIIVNIEKQTKITTVIDGEIYRIDSLDDGMGKILNEINKVENSMSKSYDVCKNMTIYTQTASELYSDTNEYMEIVTTTLSKIANETKKITTELFSNIDKIYITGLGACINNIDLYFQEYIMSSKCEILKPYFLKNQAMKLPIKEYIEVNSAIGLALDGLGMVNKDVNFVKGSKGSVEDRANKVLAKEITFDSVKDYFGNFGYNVKKEFSAPLQSTEKLLLRGMVACVMLLIAFSGFSKVISNQLDAKNEEISLATTKASSQIAKIDADIKTISERTTAYNALVTELTAPEENNTTTGTERIIAKDSIPNLLNRIMFVIPKKVKLTSIQNTTSTHIVIKAESEKYEQLGYFKAVLATNGILQNVKSTSGQKTNSVIEVTIEGDLP